MQPVPAPALAFTWPLAFAVLGLASTVIRANGRLEQDSGWGKFIIDTLVHAPAIILLAPVVYMLFVMLSLSVPLVQAVLTIFGLCLIVPLAGICGPQAEVWFNIVGSLGLRV
jgi:hypothetical protein